ACALPIYEHSDEGRSDSDDEESAPSERGDDRGRAQCSGKDAELEAQSDPGGRPCAFGCGHGFRGQSHSDAELTADADAGDESVGGEVAITEGDDTEPIEYGEEDDRL